MTDVHALDVRSKNMRAVKGRDTRPEKIFRKLIFSAGYRYRLNASTLPSTPDLYLPKYKAVVPINGCFWHAHKCSLFRLPSTNKNFWYKKLTDNILRDKRNIKHLIRDGYRILVVWECAIKGKTKLESEIILNLFCRWIESSCVVASIDSAGLTEALDSVSGNISGHTCN